MSARTRRTRREASWRTRGIVAAILGTVVLAAGIAPVGAQAPPLAPVDKQNWVDQGVLTWADYTPIRPEAWNSDTTSTGSQNQYRTAIILVDYSDQPFLITQAPGTHPFGNPQPGWTPVAQADVNQWFKDYYTVPNQYNGGQTLHGYWMEDTHGRIGVSVDVYGPYRMPGKQFEYGLATDFNGNVANQANSTCPAGHTCNRNIRTDGLAAFVANSGCSSLAACGYNNGFYVTAGHDESSTWQEFGEMLWTSQSQVTAQFGPPGATSGPVLNNAGNAITNWAPTRYVPWTSWRAAANHWPNASGNTSTQAESSGQSVFAHEFSHLRGLPDNYNNPFADNQRNFTGYWEMMSRGTFNGPGGTHNRWQIPNAGGSALGPHHMLHFKNSLNALPAGSQVTVERNTLQTQGIAVVRIKSREHQPGSDLVGLTVNFGTGGDLAGSCANQGLDSFNCPGTGFLNYRIEAVDRIGNDSFAPGHGVLLSKSKTSGTPSVWLIDPNPQNINMIDFFRPDGTPVAVVRGDPRQLNDASFHAGTRSGSKYEYIDTFNSLHMYVLDSNRDKDGVLYYDIGVRRTTGAGSFARDVALGGAVKTSWQPDSSVASCTFPLTNTGAAGSGMFDSDVYRLSATSSSGDWETILPYEVVAAKAGQTVDAVVHVKRNAGSSPTTVTLTAKSEADATKTATSTCDLSAADASANQLRSTLNGQVALGTTAGTHAADAGAHLFTKVDVRQTSDGTPKGTASFAYDSAGRALKLTATSIDSISSGIGRENNRTCTGTPPSPLPSLWCTGVTEFWGTADLLDETKHTVVVASGLRLHVTLTDRRATGGQDSFSVEAFDGNKLVFSTSWTGFGSSELTGGNVSIG